LFNQTGRVALSPDEVRERYERIRAEVGDEVAEPFRAAYGDVVRDGRLDLWSAAERALRAAGCEKVERTDLCTYCHPDLFFSHRRDKGRTGRQGVVAYIA